MDLINSGVGASENNNPFDAGKEAAQNAMAQWEGEPNIVFVYPTMHYEGKNGEGFRRMLEGIYSVFKKKPPAFGGTSCAVIANDKVLEKGVAVMSLTSPYVRFGLAASEKHKKDSFKAAQDCTVKAFDSIKERPEMKYLTLMRGKISKTFGLAPYSIMTHPGLYGEKIPGQSFLEISPDRSLDGMKSVLGRGTPIVGGVPGDSREEILRSYVFSNNNVHKNALSCCALSSDLVTGYGMAHGHEPAGKAAVITKASRNFLFELNNEPAADVIADWYGITMDEWKGVNSASHLRPGKMTAIPDLDGNYWCRFSTRPMKLMKTNPKSVPYFMKTLKLDLIDVMRKNPVFFGLRLVEGSVLSLMRGNRGSIIDAGKTNAQDCLESSENPERVGAAFLFSCEQRNLILKNDSPKEIKAFRKKVKAPTIGCYTATEIGLRGDSQPMTANETLTSFVIGDKLIGK